MEYWSIGVMEYWKEEKTPAFPPSVPPLAGLRRTGANASAFVATLTSADKTAWQGRQNREKWKNGVLEYWSDGVLGRRNDGMLEEWNDGGKEIPSGLPLRQAQDDSLYKREEIGEKDGTNVEARRKGA